MPTFELLPEDYDPYALPDDWPIDPVLGVKIFYISNSAPYVTRQPENTVHIVYRHFYREWDKEKKFRDSTPCMSKGAYRVKCSACKWSGYRRGFQCECYEDWGPYCRPWSPGPGCPSGILWSCPNCSGHGHDWVTGKVISKNEWA